MGHSTQISVTGDSLPVSRIRYRRLIAYFSDPLQETIACFSDPFTLTISAWSAILELKGGFNEIFTKCKVFRKMISFIYKKIYFGDRVPLIDHVCLSLHVIFFLYSSINTYYSRKLDKNMLYLFIFISGEISYHIRILFVCFFSKYSMYVYLFVLMKNI